jgi:hypothetical protein
MHLTRDQYIKLMDSDIARAGGELRRAGLVRSLTLSNSARG